MNYYNILYKNNREELCLRIVFCKYSFEKIKFNVL